LQELTKRLNLLTEIFKKESESSASSRKPAHATIAEPPGGEIEMKF
jgi:hypothetical protein